jgi:hypothetical protein
VHTRQRKFFYFLNNTLSITQIGHSTKSCICRVSTWDTRQRMILSSLFCWQSTKYSLSFLLFVPNLFVVCSFWTYMFNFGTFLKVFAMPIRFSLFNCISLNNSNLNYKSIEKWKTINVKIIFMLLSTSYGLNQEQTENFEHHVHRIWLRTCDLVVLKLYKTQTKLGNHETCRFVMISYLEFVMKFWHCSEKMSYTICTNLHNLYMK